MGWIVELNVIKYMLDHICIHFYVQGYTFIGFVLVKRIVGLYFSFEQIISMGIFNRLLSPSHIAWIIG